MTIPRHLDPEPGVRTLLPDYSRSAATVERMVANLQQQRAVRGRAGRSIVRTVRPADAVQDTLLRSVVAALALGGSLVMTVAAVLLWATTADGHAPGVGLLLVLLALLLAATLSALLGIRFGLVALGTARSRLEISEEGLRVVGALRTRHVPWSSIVAIESRVIHPVHWLTVGLRLRDGTRIVVPALDRHIWTYTRPSGQTIRALRAELRRRERAARGKR
ncbi:MULTISPECIES: PH domain-containing protein [unclassified Brachybacterium]|uniref:PH domain-containing protein n=1 Tax=unclassified Brachybacterium TaxID=2623841 RepID=UPI004034054A